MFPESWKRSPLALPIAGAAGLIFVGLNVYQMSASFGNGTVVAVAVFLDVLVIAAAVLAGQKRLSDVTVYVLVAVAVVALAATGTTASIVGDDSGGASLAAADGPQAMVARGRELVRERACVSCHSTDGSRRTGPSWQGLYGSQRELEGERIITADRAYLLRSILEPDADTAAGFPDGVMAMFLRSNKVNQTEAEAIAAYLETLGVPTP